MSFLSHQLHEQQRHAEYFVCRVHDGPSICLACFLHSLADPSHLDSRKAYALREFLGLFTSNEAEGHRPLHGVLTQHASMLVDGFLSAVASTQDLGLAQALHEAAAYMCRCAPEFLPELFTERLLQLLLELAWPSSTPDPTSTASVQASAAVASSLQLLQELISTHISAAGLLVQALQTYGDLITVMTSGLACGVEAVVVPLLHLFSYLARTSSVAVAAAPMGCLLPAGIAKDLFISLLQLLPDLLAPDLRVLVVQVLLKLAETGYAVEQAAQLPTAPAQILTGSSQLSQQQQHNPQQQALAGVIMSGLKPLLLDTNPQLQLLGAQLLAATAARASALLLQNLIEADACEHVYEVLRGTLTSCNMRAKLAAAALADEQRRRGPSSAAAGGRECTAVAGAAAELEVTSEALQSAAVAVLRHLANQGPSFLEHFHFGIDTLTALLQHVTNTANSPLLADTLALLAEVTAPHNPASLLLPAAALAKLATAATAVLPDAAAHTGADGSAGPISARVTQQNGGLHPSPDLQAAYEGACTLLTHLCEKWGSSSSWPALEPQIFAGMHKSLAAVSLLSSRSLAGGYLTAACKLVTVIGQLLSNVLAANSRLSSVGDAVSEPAGALTAAEQAGVSQPKHSKGGNKRRQAATAAAADKPFAKRRQQQQQQRLTGSQAGQGSDVPADLAVQQLQVDSMLSLMESVLQHLVPAASTVLTAASSELAATQQQQQQQEGVVFVHLLKAVQGVLMVVLSAGASSAELASFMPAFCSQLLSTNKWSSMIWSIMEAHALPHDAAANAWTVMLLAAAYLEGAAFMTGITHSSLPSLAASLSGRASSSIQLLELLYANSSSSQDPASAAAATAPTFYGRNSSRQAAAMAAAGNTADIRRFCGISDMHKAALCVVAAAVRSGGVCWSWLDVLTALDAAVGNAGPGMMSQPDLLYNIVQLYCQVEQQLAADLASQQYSIAHSDGVMLTDQQQQQQYLTNGTGGVQGGFEVAVQQLPVPNAVLHVLQKLGTAMPQLQPDEITAQWILARATQLPACVQQLLQRWMAALLPKATSAAAFNDSNAATSCPQAAAVLEVKQQELSAALIAALARYPSAVKEALLAAKQCLEEKQQLQLAGWLTVFAGVLVSCSSGSHPHTPHSPHDYLAVISYQSISKHTSNSAGRASSNSSSMIQLPDLVYGPSGLLELLRRSLLASLSAAASSVRASCVVVGCNTALLATVIAAGAAASAGGANGGVAGDAGSCSGERLLQQGMQQVHLAATRLVQLPAEHPLRQQLLLSTANTANALMHSGLLQQQDPALMQQLAGCHEMQQLMTALAAAAVCGDRSSNPGDVAGSRMRQQQPEESLMLQCSAGEAEMIQLQRAVLTQCGLCSSSSSSSTVPTALAETAATGPAVKPLFQPVQTESLLLAALQWWQHQQLLSLTGLAPEAAAAGNNQEVFGLTPPQLVLLAMNTGGSLLCLMLLDTTRLLLQHQAVAARASCCEVHLTPSTQQQWPQVLVALQNMVVAAATGCGNSTICQEAAVSCLATLYEAVAAGINSNCSMSSALAVVKSAWNLPVLKVVLDRLCQQATYLRNKSAEAEQAAALGAASLQQAPSRSAVGDPSTGLQGWLSWLDDADCQQRVHLWCSDAQLLLNYIKMLLVAAEAENQSAGNDSRKDKQASSSDKLFSKLQILVVPYLEQQQQLVSFLCWAAARLSLVEAAAAANRCNHHHHHQQQQYENAYQPSQQQEGRGDPPLSDNTSAQIVGYHLQHCLCDVALQLLAGLLDVGCFAGQLPWLHQQLQQHMWAVSQQQQG